MVMDSGGRLGGVDWKGVMESDERGMVMESDERWKGNSDER